MVTVDCVVVRPFADGRAGAECGDGRPDRGASAAHEVLLVRRARDPFKGMWAIPGGFVEMDEDLPAAARRELREETGLDVPALKQFRTFGRPGRDPRGRQITVVYIARVSRDVPPPRAGDDAAEARWFPFEALPRLAFDHAEVLREAREFIAEHG